MNFDWDLFVSYSMVAAMSVGALVLVVMTCFRMDFVMIKDHTAKFLLELFMICIVPSSVCFVLIYTRNISVMRATEMFIVVALHFLVLHILFDTSGYYTYLFS